jgi:hypothetical protein
VLSYFPLYPLFTQLYQNGPGIGTLTNGIRAIGPFLCVIAKQNAVASKEKQSKAKKLDLPQKKGSQPLQQVKHAVAVESRNSGDQDSRSAAGGPSRCFLSRFDLAKAERKPLMLFGPRAFSLVIKVQFTVHLK